MVKTGCRVGSSHAGNYTKTNQILDLIRARIHANPDFFMNQSKTQKEQDRLLKLKKQMFAQQNKYKWTSYNERWNTIVCLKQISAHFCIQILRIQIPNYRKTYFIFSCAFLVRIFHQI